MTVRRAALLLVALAAGFPASGFAQTPSPLDPALLAIETAYYAGKADAGREALEGMGETDDVTRAWALWRVASMHRVRDVNRQTKRRNEPIRKKMLEQAEELLKAHLESNANDADAHLVLSQVYQGRITSAFSGMRWGRRAGETLDRALELAPEDPRALYLKGVSRLMAPGPFGDKEEARRKLEAAVARFAEGPPDGAFWWGQPEAYAFLGLSFARADEPAGAREHYEKALELAPDFAWVRDRLMPALER